MKIISDKILFNIECCVPLNFVCIEKKIYWFSFIYMIVNCSVWLDIRSLPSRLTYSAVGCGKCDQHTVSGQSRLSGAALWAVITVETL